MFGSNQRGVSGYAKIGAETGVLAATPAKLIVMLYDGAITSCHSAIGYMQQKDIEKKGAMLTKAIMIIETGLRSSLNKKAGGEIAESLDALYVYMSNRLTQANVRNQPELVKEVIRLLNELKSSWEAIDQNKATVTPESPVAIKPQGAGVNRSLAYLAKV